MIGLSTPVARSPVPAGAAHSQRQARKGDVMSFITKHALTIMFAAGLSQVVALSQSPVPQTESWANRLLANDPKVRATAEAALVQGARRSLPLLRRFLNPGHED